jgi:phosphopantothenoylcysteine decarboxylase/phosphopantothenate--cysteine ligase
MYRDLRIRGSARIGMRADRRALLLYPQWADGRPLSSEDDMRGDILSGKSIVLGVSGGIAAYKAAALASLLVQDGARVEVVMTEAALRFVQPLTFAAIAHRPVHTDPFAPWGEDFSGHVSLAEQAELLIVAPATAATIARLALGLADDLLQLVALSTAAPLLIAPAMEDRMYRHPATQEHITSLTARGATVVGPESGRLASGEIGEGRLAEPATISSAARFVLGRSGPLHGRRVVVSAGGTREPLDPVRYIGNRSSGTMGYAIAAAAIEAGAEVTLVSGPVAAPPPYGANVIGVETAAEMQQAIELASDQADILIMAAAVADFRPAARSERKIKKDAATSHLDLRLVRNPDILAELDRPGLVRIGFAAETDDLIENARRKLAAKRLDAIVANDAAATIGSPDSQATILLRDGTIVPLPQMSKRKLAREIVNVAVEALALRARDGS